MWPWLLSCLVLAMSLSITVASWRMAKDAANHRLQADFDLHVREIGCRIEQRMRAYEQILRGLQGLFSSSDRVSRADFHAYVQTLRVDLHYPGIQALEFAPAFSPAELETHTRKVREEGFPGYTLYPEGARDRYSSILYIEPFSGPNLRAFGYDMLTSPARRQAMEAARDSGLATLSGKVTLVQEDASGQAQAGFLIFLPVYRNGPDRQPPRTVEERRARIAGWVLAPFRMKNLMAGILGRDAGVLDIAIDDAPNAGESSRLYASWDERALRRKPLLSHTNHLHLLTGGRPWTVRVASSPEFEARANTALPRLVAMAGTGASLLLTLIVVVLTTAHKRAERLVRDRTELLSGLLESIPEIVFFKDRAGAYLGCNSEFARLVGRPHAEIVGRTDLDLFSREFASDFQSQDRLILEQGKPRHNEEWIVYPDGTRLLVDTLKAPLRDSTGRIIGLVAASRDMTERRRLEDELRQSHARLAAVVGDLERSRDAAEAAARAKNAFVANMSHEIRTPLNAILGYVQIMRRICDKCPEQGTALDVISQSGEHLLSMINDILSVSKMDANKVILREEDFDLHALVTDVVRMFEARPKVAPLRFVSDLDPATPREVRADSGKIRQVLMNLLGNAVRFTTQGCITVRLRASPPMPPAASAEAAFGPACILTLEVEDTGPGIPPTELEAIFAPFEQGASGRQTQTGTGLGLTISRRLARSMGGDITVTSQVGVGSCFRFTFRCERAQAPVAAREATARQVLRLSPSEPTCSLLVVDDDATNRAMLGAILRMVGFHVRSASSGAAALAELNLAIPHAVLLDLQMPGMDGFETLRRMREQVAPRSLPVLIVSAADSSEVQQRLAQVGAIGYVSKPLHEQQLFQELQRLLGLTYVYRTEELALTPEQVESAVIARLAALPDDERRAIRGAVRQGDIGALRQLLGSVADGHAEIGAFLRPLTDRYEYDLLNRLLDAADTETPR